MKHLLRKYDVASLWCIPLGNMKCALHIFQLPELKWLAQVDSNHRPRAYQARALTTWAMSHYLGRSRDLPCDLEKPFNGCTPSCAGGDDGIRTHDPLLAGQVLSQLSYTPIFASQWYWTSFSDIAFGSDIELCSVIYCFAMFRSFPLSVF